MDEEGVGVDFALKLLQLPEVLEVNVDENTKQPSEDFLANFDQVFREFRFVSLGENGLVR